MGLIIAALGLVAFVLSFQSAYKGFRIPGVAAVVLGVMVMAVQQAVVIVPNGRVGVVFNALSGLKPNPVGPGTHFVTPGLESLVFYDTQLQERTLSRRGEGGPNIDESINASSKEGLQISVDVTVQYQVKESQVIELHRAVGPNFEDKIIVPRMRSEVRDVIGRFNSAELISTKREELKSAAKVALEKSFGEQNITLIDVLIREIRIPDSLSKAIEEKQRAEQLVQQRKNEREAERIVAETAIIKAQGEAKAAVERAQGEAKSLSLKGQSLRQNPELIQLTVAEKLAPGIETIMLPATGNFLLDMSNLSKRVSGTSTP
jgi:regulator of protease activity HflC (stomatin/prohibitin superfamily)